MIDFVKAGGYGMFPVMLLGAFAVGVAIWFAVRGNREVLALVVGASAATLLMGVLSTVIGIQVSARAIGGVEASERWIFLLGLQESLNGVVAALAAVMIATMIATVGAYRAMRAHGMPVGAGA